MSQRIQLKRSSISGKRPDSTYLEPGELALNTNVNTPGAFFETNDGNIAKVGPNHVGLTAPSTDQPYGNGESWFDEGNNTFKTFSVAANNWLTANSPTFSGSQHVLFVGTSYPEASDSLSNDGTARPFSTLNRACLEVARRSIYTQRVDAEAQAQFVIFLLPGDNTISNEPGLAVDTFDSEVPTFISDQALPLSTLRTFNPTTGGVIVPRGTSLAGFELKKTVCRPTWYPAWTRAQYEGDETQIEARSSVLKWTGDSYATNLTLRDKVSEVSVTAISGADTAVATLTSLDPHGYRTFLLVEDAITAGDQVTLTYPSNVTRSYDGQAIAPEGTYWVDPITPTTFQLRKVDGSQVLRNELPDSPGSLTNPPQFLQLTYKNTTHHRLSGLMFASEVELNDYYTKVQTAFKALDFSGTINNAEVNPGETVIVAPVPSASTYLTNTTKNTSPFAFNISMLSDFGMCGIDVDGEIVTGFKTAQADQFTSVSLQNDADVYEVYFNNAWGSLKAAYAYAKTTNITSVTNAQAMEYLSSTVPTENLRYYYRAAKDAGTKSSGLPNEKSDTRHWCLRAVNGGVVEASSCEAVGQAVEYWAKDGGNLTLGKSDAEFGTQALRAEGFLGIGSAGGALPPNQGFAVSGVRRPLNVTKAQLLDTKNHRQYSITAQIAAITATQISFLNPIDESMILPFTLKVGTAVWITDIATGTAYSAIIASPGLNANKNTLALSSVANDIFTQFGASIATASNIYVRRFVDPRTEEEKSYSLWLTNSNATHSSPEIGSILRFAEKPGAGYTGYLQPGIQLDPGETGGWNQTFAVHSAVNREEGDNLNPDLAISNGSRNEYYASLVLCDNAAPWIQNVTEPAGDDHRLEDGAIVTYNNRNWVTNCNQLTASTTSPAPTETLSGWSGKKPYEVLQPIDEAYFDASFASGDDPNTAKYPAGSDYLRGIAVDTNSYALVLSPNEDDGTTTLGLQGTGDYANYGDPAKLDPSFSDSKMAMTRLFRLLGYPTASIDGMFLPQREIERNLAVTDFLSVDSDGYTLSVGPYPIEFNKASKITTVGMTWNWCGYWAYSKGLPEYRSSPTTIKQRLNYVISEAWGGVITCSGITESGDFILNAVNMTNSIGRTV